VERCCRRACTEDTLPTDQMRALILLPMAGLREWRQASPLHVSFDSCLLQNVHEGMLAVLHMLHGCDALDVCCCSMWKRGRWDLSGSEST
jgi:hypothetical protein